MKLTNEQIEQILDGSFDEQLGEFTLVVRNRLYKRGGKGWLSKLLDGTGLTDKLQPNTEIVQNLSDLREILTLRQRVQELEKRLQKKRSTIDVSLGDLEQLLKHARHFSMNSNLDVFAFDLVEPTPFINPSLKKEEATYVCYRAIIRRDYHFGWVARFELKEQDDE